MATQDKIEAYLADLETRKAALSAELEEIVAKLNAGVARKDAIREELRNIEGAVAELKRLEADAYGSMFGVRIKAAKDIIGVRGIDLRLKASTDYTFGRARTGDALSGFAMQKNGGEGYLYISAAAAAGVDIPAGGVLFEAEILAAAGATKPVLEIELARVNEQDAADIIETNVVEIPSG